MIYGTTEGVFRSIANAGWGVKSDGDVEAPVGYFTLVEIPSHDGERAEMRDAVFGENLDEEAIFDKVEAGWYIVTQSSTGNIFVNPCKDEVEANKRYSNLEEGYSEFVGE
jgi:hypothetical protein